MAKRERLEDLGRILERLENLNDEIDWPNKWTLDKWENQADELKFKIVEEFYTDLRKIEDCFDFCLLIARGHDDLNSSEY